MNPTEGRELLDFIDTLDEVVWAKFEARRPTFSFKNTAPFSEDRSAKPPYTSFRFKNDNPELLEKLQLAVSEYKGQVEWSMSGHKRESLPGTNWLICPTRLLQIESIALSANLTPGDYMAQHEPKFGPVAYDDMRGLVQYLRRVMSSRK